MGGPCGPRPQEGARGGRGRSPEGKPRALAPSEMLKGIFDAQRCEKCTKWPLIWAQMPATFPFALFNLRKGVLLPFRAIPGLCFLCYFGANASGPGVG